MEMDYRQFAPGMVQESPLDVEYIKGRWAYWAGFFDGDGSIRENSWEVNFAQSTKQDKVLFRLSRFLDKFGIRHTMTVYQSGDYAPVRHVHVYGKRHVQPLLEEMAPHLIVKAEKARKLVGDVPGILNQDRAWPYIAGFFDAEGNINFTIGNDSGRTKRPPRVRLTQGEFQANVLTQIKSFLDSAGIPSAYHVEQTRKNPIGRLEIRQLAAVDKFLKSTLPWLIVKKSKAWEAISIIESTEWGHLERTEEERRRISESLKQYFAENPQSEEWKEKNRQGLLAHWADPLNRARRVQSAKQSWLNNPERKNAVSWKLKEYLNLHPEEVELRRQKLAMYNERRKQQAEARKSLLPPRPSHSEACRMAWSDPEKRKRRIEAIRATRLKNKLAKEAMLAPEANSAN